MGVHPAAAVEAAACAIVQELQVRNGNTLESVGEADASSEINKGNKLQVVF